MQGLGLDVTLYLWHYSYMVSYRDQRKQRGIIMKKSPAELIAEAAQLESDALEIRRVINYPSRQVSILMAGAARKRSRNNGA
jgi:hypothetical protein